MNDDHSTAPDFRNIISWVRDYVDETADHTVANDAFSNWLASRRLSGAWPSPQAVRAAFLGHVPESFTRLASFANAQEAAAGIAQCLSSREFRLHAPEILVATYPDAPRGFFVHIPKTAGSSVTTEFMKQGKRFVWCQAFESYPDFSLQNETILSSLSRFDRIDTKRLFFCGHYTLRELRGRGLLRSGDQAFTVIRDPIAATVSMINFILTEMTARPSEWYVRMWREHFSSTGLEETRQDGFVSIGNFQRILHSKAFPALWSSSICAHWGEATEGNLLDSAMSNLLATNVAIVDIAALPEYLRQEWGITLEEERRVSKKAVRHASDLDAGSRFLLHRLNANDVAMYDFLKKLMQEKNRQVLHPQQDFKSRMPGTLLPEGR